MKSIKLIVEPLERRLLLAAPIKPFDLDLLAAGDSGSSDSDDITNISDGVIELIAETDSTVAVYNAGCLGDAAGQDDTLFYETGGSVTIEAEKGTITFPMEIKSGTADYQGTGYIEDKDATSGHPENGGTAAYIFYITTAGDYYVHGRVYFDNSDRNSFFVNIDDQWDIGENGPGLWSDTLGAWHFATATTQVNQAEVQTWHLTVGWHTLEIHGREKRSKLDRFVISTNGAAPGDPGGAESVTYETYQYTFGAGELIGSAYGTVNNIKVTAENLDGTSDFSDPLAITYDNATITPGGTELETSSDTGDSNTDNLTNDTTATFSGGAGSVESNAAVYLRVGAVNKRNTTADADGSYSVTLEAGDLAEGANAVDIYYVDAAGNSSADSADATVTLDTIANAPAVAPDLAAGSDTGLDNGDDYTNDTTPTFTGAAGAVEDNSTVWLRVGGVNKQSVSAAADGSYSITLAEGILTEGDNVVDIIYIDPAGNTSGDSANLTVTLDTVSDEPAAPDLTSNATHDTGASQVDNITNNKNCEITGAAVANGTVHIRVNGVEAAAVGSDGGGNWSYDFIDGDLAEGANNVNVTAEDSLGNPESAYSGSLIIVLDTILATPAAPDLRAVSDTGFSNTDNITGDDAAWFDGYAEPGSTVQIFVGAAGKGADTADAATGAWSIQLDNGDLAVGNNDITVTATDAAGNSDTSAVLVITFDSAAPAQPGTPDLAGADDSGSSSVDNLTNVTDPTITGAAEANSTVNIDINAGAHTDTVAAAADGTWSYHITDGWLNEGDNTIFVTATDAAANTSIASGNLVITLDTIDPALAAVPDLDTASDTGYMEYPGFDNDDLTNDTTATFIGAAGSVDADMQVDLRVGAATLASTTANGDGSYSITLAEGDLSEGANDVYIRVTDTAGNSRDSGVLTVTLDTTAAAPAAAPDLDAGSDSGNNSDDVTNIAAATFTGAAGTVPNDSKVFLRVNGVSARSTTNTPDGSYSVTLQAGDLDEGGNVIDIIYVDPAGNTSSDGPDLTVTLDTVMATPAAPDLRAASDTGFSNTDNITGDDAAWFDGYAEPGSTVQIFVGAAGKGTDTADAATGAWSIQLDNGDLAVGANDITVTATDAAGNAATSPVLVVTYDGGASVPNAPLLSASSDSGSSDADGITNIAAVTIYGSVAGGNPVEAGATVHVRTNKNGGGWVEVGTAAADSNGNWSYTFDGVDDLDEGANLVDVYITDLAGDDSADSNDLAITLDTTANNPATGPDLNSVNDTGASNSDNITSDTACNFSGPNGSVEADSTVWLRIDGSNVRSVAADGNGAYSITLLAGDMTEGAHLVDMFYIDPAGNSSGDSPDLAVTLDTQTAAPPAPDLDGASDTGDSSSDDLTNDTTATWTGPANSVEGDSTVYLRVGGIDKRSTAANADGSYSITLQVGDLEEGANLIDIYYQDPAGNVSAQGPDLTVHLDTAIADPSLPDLAEASDTGSDNSDDITAETRPTIQGAAGTVEGLSTVRIWLDTPGEDDLEVGTTAAAADGSWSYTFTSANPLEEGVNIIHVVAVDPAGNVSNSSANLTVTVDFGTGAQSAPDLDPICDTGSADDDDITTDNTPTISGACPAGAEVKLRMNAVIMATFTDNDASDGNAAVGMWSYTFNAGDLNEGVNTIAFLTIDTQLSTSDWSQDLVVTLDTNIQQPTKPNLITADDSGSDSGDDITNETAPTITGTAEANSTVTVDINGGIHTDTAAADANGIWSYTLTSGWLNEGANAIFVSATDVAGNVSAASSDLIITLDTTINAPSQPDLTAATDTGGSNSDNITRHANPRIVGMADADTTIKIRLDPEGAATVVGTTWADGLGNWNYTFASDDLAEGANVIDVLSTDVAGNSADSANLTITVETVINAPMALDLQAASDLGDADDDDLTSLAASTITGGADPNCTIYIRVNGSEVGSTTSDGMGDWSYTFDGGDDLIEGINIIDSYAEDAVGNVSDYSDDLVVTLDTMVAIPAAPDLETASDSGLNDVDNYTNIAPATICGACEPQATITISLNGNDSYDTTTDNDDGMVDGLWSYTFAGDLNGSVGGEDNVIRVAQRDPAGNASAFSAPLTIILDDAAETPATPDLLAVSDSGDADDDDLTNIPNITIAGTVETNSSVQLFIDQGSGPVLADTISELLISTGTWNYTFASGQLTEGANQITVVAIDKADNVSIPSAPLVIALDTIIAQPSLPDLAAGCDTGDFDNDEITSDETPTFTGLADPNVHVTIRVDGEPINTVESDLAGDWSYTFAQGEIQTGVHRIDAVATDPAGNISVPSDDLTIWLNVEPTQPAGPNLLAGSDSGSISTDNLTNITAPVIEGKADADCTVFVYADGELTGSSTTDEDGFWEYIFTEGDLKEGNNEITIITEDSSGLRSSASYPLIIILDTIPPTASAPDLQPASDTGVSDSDNLTSDETATIEGATEPAALIDLYHNAEHMTQLTATALGNWSFTFGPGILAEGDNDIYVTITDLAGNLSQVSEVLTIVLDVQQDAPEAPIISPETDTGVSDNDGLTNNPNPEITGTVKPNSSVEVRVSGLIAAAVPADDQGNWQYTFEPDQLNEGLNYVEIISTDPVGNTARSEVLELTLDTVAPVLYNYFPKGIHTHTTQIIELYINGNDLDALAAYDTAGYILRGAGGDGGFADGNEWIIPISGVTLDTVAGLVQINTIITLTDDAYQLILDPSVSLRDEAGNSVQLNLSSQQGPSYAGQTEPLVLEFIIDTEGPPAPAAPELDADSDSGSDDSDNITNEADPLIHITADPDITVELICNGRSAGFANETAPGNYYLIIENSFLREGENLLLARAYDALGNSSDLSDSQTFIYDCEGPEVAAIVVDLLWLNFGPTQITTVFAETDIDPATIEDFDTYILLGSGGDGTFDDGNEIPITPTNIYYDSATRSTILTMPQTVAGRSELGPDTYRLTILADGAITDMAGNAMSASACQEFLVVPAKTIHSNQHYQFITAEQTRVTVALEGAGDAVVLLGEAVGSENTIEKIVVSNTNEDTRLWIRDPSPKSTATVGQILVDSPLKAIRAGRVDITQQIEVSQSLSCLKVGAIYDNAVLNLTSDTEEAEIDSDDGLRIYTGDVGQNVQLNVSGHLRFFKAPQYQGGAIAADSIYAIQIKRGDMAAEVNVAEGDLSRIKVYRGDLTGDLDVSGQIGQVKAPRGQLTANIRAEENINLLRAHSGQSASISAGNDIGKVKFKGDLGGSTISAGGNITAIKVHGDALDNLFLAGADLGPDGHLNGVDDQFSSGDLNYLRVVGSYLGSISAAGVNPGSDLRYFTPDDQAGSVGDIARVKFGLYSLSQTMADDPFGLLASNSIAPFRLNGLLYQAPFELNQFHLVIVE